MRNAIAALFTALLLVCATVKADVLIGYDGDCQVFFDPSRGYTEVCEQQEPVILGFDFDVHRFRHEFREGPGFREHFGRHWEGPRVRYQTRETTTVHRKGR